MAKVESPGNFETYVLFTILPETNVISNPACGHARPPHPARMHYRFKRTCPLAAAGPPRRPADQRPAHRRRRHRQPHDRRPRRILLAKWGNPAAQFLPLAADLDSMLERADAAVVIGDPALLALEERANRFERTGEELIYHDLAEEWHALTGLPFVSAVWAAAPGSLLDESVTADFVQSRIHGLENIDTLVAEWTRQLPLSEQTIRTYLTSNIHYTLDDECIAAMKTFFRLAAECGVLPE